MSAELKSALNDVKKGYYLEITPENEEAYTIIDNVPEYYTRDREYEMLYASLRQSFPKGTDEEFTEALHDAIVEYLITKVEEVDDRVFIYGDAKWIVENEGWKGAPLSDTSVREAIFSLLYDNNRNLYKDASDKLATPPDDDLEKENPISESMKGLDYLYVAGSSPKEIHRYFILPPSAQVKVIYFKEGSRKATRTITTLEKAKTLKLATIQTLDGERILPDDPEELKTLVISGQVFRRSGSLPPQIRRDGKIVRQITDEDVNKWMDSTEDLTVDMLYDAK